MPSYSTENDLPNSSNKLKKKKKLWPRALTSEIECGSQKQYVRMKMDGSVGTYLCLDLILIMKGCEIQMRWGILYIGGNITDNELVNVVIVLVHGRRKWCNYVKKYCFGALEACILWHLVWVWITMSGAWPTSDPFCDHLIIKCGLLYNDILCS